ncbi:MAG: hypothetical protein WHS44_07395 [Fimbriimonadales bacterium]|nr:MAG: hypothetical protein KatS3mg018_1282 [Fimbriimonadales bacterium]
MQLKSRRRYARTVWLIMAVVFWGAAIDIFLSLRAARESSATQDKLGRLTDELTAGRASDNRDNPVLTENDIEPRDEYNTVVDLVLSEEEAVRQRPVLSFEQQIQRVDTYNLDTLIGLPSYYVSIDAVSRPPQWFRRTSSRARAGEQALSLWGFYSFGKLFLTNWERGDTRLEEAFARPVQASESVYRLAVSPNPQERYVWSFFAGAIVQIHEYTAEGILKRSRAIFRSREEAQRSVLWLQRADGVLIPNRLMRAP